jgi:anthranilate phosphoribosyltransferase
MNDLKKETQKSDLADIYNKLESGERLNYYDLKSYVRAVRSGEVDAYRFVAVLAIMETRNRLKGIDIQETANFVRALRYDGMPDPEGVVCTAGTGGDPVKTVNVSTAAALVLAAGGIPVMKNGYKNITGKCGSRDILKCWGIDPFLPIDCVLKTVRDIKIGYYDFANLIVREERSGFHSPLHYIGALSHPVNVRYKILGCCDKKQFSVIERLADELFDNYFISLNPDVDELSTVSSNFVVEKRNGKKCRYTLNPKELNINHKSYAGVEALPTPAANAAFLKDVLKCRKGHALDLIALNAAAAFYLCGKADTIANGLSQAYEILKTGGALDILKRWKTYANGQSSKIHARRKSLPARPDKNRMSHKDRKKNL